MVTYTQSTNPATAATIDLNAMLAGMTSVSVTGSLAIFQGLRVYLNSANYLDLQGTDLAITTVDGALQFTGNVTRLLYMNGETGTFAFTINGLNLSLQTLLTTPTAMFSGDDDLTGWFGSNALYGYGGNDYLDGSPDGPVAGVQDTLYGGDGDDTFIITETVFSGQANSVIFGGSGTDTLFYNWTNTELTAILNMGRLTTQPTGIEELQFYATDYSGNPTFASVTALPGAGLLAMAGLTGISGLRQIKATAAGTIDLSGVVMTNEGGNFRYYGTSGNDAFLAPRSFTPGTDVQYFGDGGDDTLGGFADVVENLFGGMGDDTYIVGVGDYI